MTKITVFRNRDGEYLGFDCLGHAGYAKEGEDIVCAGISALTINTINSLGMYTAEKFETEADEESGEIRVRFEHPAGHDAELLMKSLVLGLQGIQNTYGNDYIVLNFKEV
ncbi:MAG: ribosomal-processing cysteine protease Prp [Roseburia sp.]|nr:ribosomal-processing cysteine protease Prp [Roseburia sp.]